MNSLWQLLQSDRPRVKARGQFAAAFYRAIGDDHSARCMRGEMRRGKFYHFARAD